MNNDKETSNKADENGLTREKLIRSALESKLEAIGGYDDILWKIRAGYVAILYGALTLIIGEKGIPNFSIVTGSFSRSLSLFFLIFGFSLSAFIIDVSYLAKKLKVVVARDLLVEIGLDPTGGTDETLKTLVHIAGEMPLELFPSDAVAEFRAKMSWNRRRILLPLYATTPALAILVYAIDTWVL